MNNNINKGDLVYIDGVPNTIQFADDFNKKTGLVKDYYEYKNDYGILMNFIDVDIKDLGIMPIDSNYVYKLSKGIDNIKLHTNTLNNPFKYYYKKDNLIFAFPSIYREKNLFGIIGLQWDQSKKFYITSTQN